MSRVEDAVGMQGRSHLLYTILGVLHSTTLLLCDGKLAWWPSAKAGHRSRLHASTGSRQPAFRVWLPVPFEPQPEKMPLQLCTAAAVVSGSTCHR